MICPNDEEQAQHDGECDPNFHSIIKPRISGLFPSHDSATKILTLTIVTRLSTYQHCGRDCRAVLWLGEKLVDYNYCIMQWCEGNKPDVSGLSQSGGAAVAEATKVINETNAYRCVLSYYISSVQVIVKINARQESSQNQNSRTLCAYCVINIQHLQHM